MEQYSMPLTSRMAQAAAAECMQTNDGVESCSSAEVHGGSRFMTHAFLPLQAARTSSRSIGDHTRM